jgi:cyclophilin family peptidyl-prolyl cis-trans isomerase
MLLAAMLLLVGCGTPTPSGTASEESSPGSPPAAEPAGEAPAAENAAVTSRNDKYSAVPEMAIDQNKTYIATIETTKGTLKAELFAKDAPMTVNNFVVLARDGYFDGIKFHRIVNGFMVQTGDPKGDGTGGPGYSFDDEPVTRDYVRGTLAMANAGPNTNGSQFFIIHQDYPLDKKYTIFGQVTEGLETLDAIANIPVATNPMSGENSMPQEDVSMTQVTIEEK